jgi:murein tripeptide amidase MpaA
MLRSSVRLYPDAEDKEGLYPEDIDGDGRILLMRIADPNGSWKVSPQDKRLMVRRGPGESGGAYYRLYTEGLIRDLNGVEVRPAPPKRGLDFNRNYPGTWAPESVQRGAGRFPGSEPEVRTVLEFMHSRKNIAGAMSYHTPGGMILRPHCAKPDEKLPRQDLQVMKSLADVGRRLTGYPTWSIYEEFTVDKGRPQVGSWVDWGYDLNGILPLAIELWDMSQHAGLAKLKPKEISELTPAETEARGLALLRWNDFALAGSGFVRWHDCEHPQLGRVELGGWKPKTAIQNPPLELLEGECRKCAMFTLAHAAMAPRLRITSLSALEIGAKSGAGDGGDRRLYKLAATIENQGYLPTHVTQQGLASKAVRQLEARLTVEGAGPRMVVGKARAEIGHLPGHALGTGGHGGPPTPETRKKLEWVIAARPGANVLLQVSNEKCGLQRRRLSL